MIQIDIDLLITYGASTEKVKKGDFIFREEGHPFFFFHLLEGEVKMFSLNRQGKEMIQGVFHSGCSFGEPPIFIDKPYPSSAIAMKDSIVLKLSKDKLNVLIEDNPKVALEMIRGFSEKIYQKTITIQILGGSDPEEKIISFLDQVKDISGVSEQLKIPYTRQQIADSTGLCVETVIRTLIKLNEEKVVEIKKHKVYY